MNVRVTSNATKMHIIIYFVLIVCPSIMMGKPDPRPLTEADINKYADEKTSIITGSNAHTLLLLKEGDIGEIDNAIVCKGTYDSEPVDAKIFWDKKSMQEEMSMYDALLTPQDPKPEGLDIPKLYYSGPVLEKYNAIVLAFTEESKEIEIEDETPTKSQKPVRRVHFKEEPKIVFSTANIDELIEQEDKIATRHRPFPRYAGLDKEESKIATRNRKNVRGKELLEEADETAAKDGSAKCLNLKGRISRKLLQAKLDFKLMRQRLMKK